jgi:hypothetical protein
MSIVVASQQLYQCLVYYLSFSITLSMEGNVLLQIGIHSFTKRCLISAQEHVFAIIYDVVWKSALYPDMDEK